MLISAVRQARRAVVTAFVARGSQTAASRAREFSSVVRQGKHAAVAEGYSAILWPNTIWRLHVWDSAVRLERSSAARVFAAIRCHNATSLVPAFP